MNANPIMLVVVAIGALIAGLVLAYQHSETFRHIVDAVASVLRDGRTQEVPVSQLEFRPKCSLPSSRVCYR